MCAPFPTWEPCKANQKSILSHTKDPSYFCVGLLLGASSPLKRCILLTLVSKD